jgi:hypothetical protein
VSEWHVRLLIPVDAEDATEAVEAFIDKINIMGIRSYLFRATDIESGETFLVSDRAVISEADALELADEVDDEAGYEVED